MWLMRARGQTAAATCSARRNFLYPAFSLDRFLSPQLFTRPINSTKNTPRPQLVSLYSFGVGVSPSSSIRCPPFARCRRRNMVSCCILQTAMLFNAGSECVLQDPYRVHPLTLRSCTAP